MTPQKEDRLMTTYWKCMAKRMEEFGCDYTAKQLSKPEWCIAELARLGYSIRFSALTVQHLEEQFGRPIACPEAFTPPAITYSMRGPLLEQWGANPTCIRHNLAESAAAALYSMRAAHWRYDNKRESGCGE